MFCAFRFGGFKDAHSHVTPPSYLGTAARAGDGTVICRMVWDDESIATALTAGKRGVHVPLDRLSHGIASIRMGIGHNYTLKVRSSSKSPTTPNPA